LSPEESKEFRSIIAWASSSFWIFVAVPYVWIVVMALALFGARARSLNSAAVERAELAAIASSL
jgi:hypothetical protein